MEVKMIQQKQRKIEADIKSSMVASRPLLDRSGVGPSDQVNGVDSHTELAVKRNRGGGE